MANYQRDADKERYWRGVLDRQAMSELSVRSFCRRERLSEASFYAWRRTIGERDRMSIPASAFLPVVVSDEVPPNRASIVIELAGGRVLRLPESISTERLVELVAALEARTAP
ncbi:MAG: hypothetical protein KF708_24915 [Pirellulales bacterium]|nr:hypothetical protein [Pirellulales bacterium]